MSKINLTPNASGTGTLTVTSPNTNSDYTLTLPAVTGTFNTSGAVNEVPAGSNTAPSIYFTGDTNTGIYSPGADQIAIVTGGVAAISVSSGQRSTFPTTIGVGGATPSTSGSGISFPATQSASTDANTLDDYEEGTWTPTAYGGTVTGTTTYVTQRGYYVKVGRQVTISFYVAYSAMTGTGNLRVGGFPFNLIATYDAVGTLQTSNLDWGSVGQLTLYGEESNNFARIFISTDNAAWAAQQCVNESADISGSLTFYTT